GETEAGLCEEPQVIVGKPLARIDEPGRDAGRVQRRPEAVAGAGEGGADLRRPQAGIDADDEQTAGVDVDVVDDGVAEIVEVGRGRPRPDTLVPGAPAHRGRSSAPKRTAPSD